MIGLEQPVERQQSRQQCRHPDDPRPDALQDRRLRTDAERKQHDGEDEKAEHETGIAALAQGEAQIAPEEAGKRRHRSAGIGIGGRRGEGVERENARQHRCRSAYGWRRRRARRAARWLGDRRARGERLIVLRRARSSARRAARPAPASRSDPGERQPPALACGKPSARPVGNRVERKCRQRRLDTRRIPASSAAAQRRPEQPRFRGASSRASRHPDGRHSGAARDRPAMSASIGRSPQRSRPAAGATRVARTRNRLVLPLPFAPVSISAPPAGRRNDTPAKTRRSPRRQAMSSATRSGPASVNGGRTHLILGAARQARRP